MTLQEAIRTGRKFTRSCFPKGTWMWFGDNNDLLSYVSDTSLGYGKNLTMEDILTDDWIVKNTIDDDKLMNSVITVLNGYYNFTADKAKEIAEKVVEFNRRG